MYRARVGIGMPVYNGERYLVEAIHANLAQTYGDFVLIISDNASTDRTREICSDFAAKDKRVVYLRNAENVGAAGNYAKCFEPAACEYFRWSNADDIPEPTLVEKCLAVLESDKSTVLAYGKCRIIDENGAALEDYDDNLNLTQRRPSERFAACLEQIGLNNVVYGLMRRDALARTPLFKGFPGADLILVAELSLYGRFFEIPELLFRRRMHPDASSWDRKDVQRQMTFWDPLTKKPAFKHSRHLAGYCRAVMQAPIPPGEKAILSKLLFKMAYWRKGELLTDLRDLIRYQVGRRIG